ncbi:hypothetical protein D1007_11819 [Hordeum vulgare]|nr:hypothetical protein D1007_11819 [Hordeum vulgare]
MADARPVRTERHATRVAKTAPVGAAGARRSPSPMVNAATGPEVQEQQGSSHPVTEQADGYTTTPLLTRSSGSASHVRPEMPHGRCGLAMATELLRYRPAPDRHDDWLQRIEELIVVAGDSTTPRSVSRTPCLGRKHDTAPGLVNPERDPEMKQAARWSPAPRRCMRSPDAANFAS